MATEVPKKNGLLFWLDRQVLREAMVNQLTNLLVRMDLKAL